MSPEYRKQLLALKAKVERLIADAESLSVEVPEDELLLGASKQLTDLKDTLRQIEEKLNRV